MGGVRQFREAVADPPVVLRGQPMGLVSDDAKSKVFVFSAQKLVNTSDSFIPIYNCDSFALLTKIITRANATLKHISQKPGKIRHSSIYPKKVFMP